MHYLFCIYISQRASVVLGPTGEPLTWCLSCKKVLRAKQRIVDLTKAFDPVSRNELWKILRKLGWPPKFLAMVIQLRAVHENQLGQVRHGNIISRPFKITNGVKQGRVLMPTLFTFFFSMMQHVTEDLDDKDGIYIRFRTDGCLFNLRHLLAHTKTKEKLIRELLFIDDAALVAHTVGHAEYNILLCRSCSALQKKNTTHPASP